MDTLSKWNVARRLETRALLIAINAVASLSIFFFGYDQGVMGGVNNNCNYAGKMGFGTCSTDKDGTKSVTVNHTLLQGGIVSRLCQNSKNIWSDWKSGCRVLSPRDSVWLPSGWLVW